MAVAMAGGLVLAWHSLPPGVVSWGAAGDALLASVRLTGPAAAGIAAWMATADRRTGLGKLERLAVRSATSRPLGRLGAAAVVALTGYLVIAAGLAGWMTAHGPVAGPVPATEVLAGAAALLCFVCIGFLLGSLVPPSGPPALPALAVAAGAWLITLLAGPAGPGQLAGWGWLRLLVAPALHHPLFTQWRPALFGAELAWFTGLACSVMLVFCWTVGRRRRYLGAALIPLAVAVAGAGWIHAGRQRPVMPENSQLACQSWPLVICVHPALAGALPQLEPVFTTIAAHVAGTPAAIRRIVQYPAGAAPGLQQAGPGPGPGGSYAIQLASLAPGYQGGLESAVVAQIVPACVGPAGALDKPVRGWLLDTPMPGDVTRDVGTVALPGDTGRPDVIFGGYTEQQRRTWLSQHYRQVVSCSLSPGDFRAAPKRPHHSPYPDMPGH
jgi:hypothetical protein